MSETKQTLRCSRCSVPVYLTPDWTLWPWPDGEQLCASCNDKRHKVDDYTEVERRVLAAKSAGSK